MSKFWEFNFGKFFIFIEVNIRSILSLGFHSQIFTDGANLYAAIGPLRLYLDF